MNAARRPALPRLETFARSVALPVTAAAAFAWHERPGALEALTPPWERIRLVSVSDGIRDGSRVVVRARVGLSLGGAFIGAWTTWVMEHHGYAAGPGPHEFSDRMLRGPFAAWEHRHSFTDAGEGACVMTDVVRYALPMGAAGRIAAGWFARRKLEKLFAWRHAVTRASLG